MTTIHNHVSPRTRLAVLAVGAAIGLAGVGTTLASAGDEGDYASPKRLQSGFGPAGRPGTPTVTAEAGGTSGGYGSAALLQLGHGPGGPPSSR